MTYFEWISNLEKLKTGPRDETILNTLYNSTIELSENILYRFIVHVNDVIRTRLKSSLEGLLIKMDTIHNDMNALSLEILNIKKELSFSKKIINIPIIPEENKNKFRETLQKFANEINDTLEASVSGVDTTGEAIMMIKNSKINKLED